MVVEEMFLQAGLYDDDLRVREIVYILIVQCVVWGLGFFYVYVNEMMMEEVGKIYFEYILRGWMKMEKELLIFEQYLYLC